MITATSPSPTSSRPMIVTFAAWYRAEGTLDIHSIVTRRREVFYWLAVVFTFAMGTALGDLFATTFHLGYLASAFLFAALICVPLIAWRLGASPVLTFWVAYILTRPVGASFADYIGNHIFKPLGMNRSTFVQPLPKEFEADMSLGYRSASDGKPVDFELVESSPAGALTSTAPDMARFMMAHLNNGALGDGN